MSAVGENISDAVEGIPGFSYVAGVYEDVAPDYLKTKDPFYMKVNGQRKRRKPPPGITDQQRRMWKKIMKKAWYHDRNLFSCCMGIDLGLGMIPVVNIFPVIGPIIAYSMHSALVKRCADAGLPAKNQAAMIGNVTLDFVISLVPVLGILFSWMHSCSTRNAALFDTWLKTQGDRVEAARGAHAQQQAVFNEDARRRAALGAAGGAGAGAPTRAAPGRAGAQQPAMAQPGRHQHPRGQPQPGTVSRQAAGPPGGAPRQSRLPGGPDGPTQGYSHAPTHGQAPAQASGPARQMPAVTSGVYATGGNQPGPPSTSVYAQPGPGNSRSPQTQNRHGGHGGAYGSSGSPRGQPSGPSWGPAPPAAPVAAARPPPASHTYRTR